MSNATDGPVDRLVNARWIEIGLSQADLAEVLGVAFQQTWKDDIGSNKAGAGRLTQVAEALDVPVGLFHGRAVEAGQKNPDLSSLQSLLELRLLRAFHELRDHRTKRMLVQLAERIIKRQANRRGDAG